MTRRRRAEHREPERQKAVPVALVAGLGALALYVATAARDIVVGDPTEFTIAALTGGVAHPPGYPLLTLLGRAFAALPLDPPAFGVNLVSVLAGAGSVALVALTAHRLGAPAPAAIVGALVCGTAPVVWRWTVVVEAFPLNDLIVAGIVLALVAWHARPRAALPVAAAGLLGGLALTNHQTAALIAPGVLVALWQERAALRERPTRLLIGGAAFALGLTPYAYVPIASAADPLWNWGRVSSLEELWALVTRETYGSTQLVSEAGLRGGSALARLGLLLGSYGPLEATLLVAGTVAAFLRARWYLWRTLAAVALAGPAFVAYADIDPTRLVSAAVLERFFLLPHALTAPLLGLGIAALAEQAMKSVGSRQAARVVLATAALATAVAAVATYPMVDRREDRVARHYGLDILASAEPGTLLLTVGDDASTAVAYLQLVEGARPEVTHIIAPLLRTDWYVRQLRDGQPDVRVPFERLGGAATLRQLVEANPDRTIAVVGGLLDDSLAQTHWLFTQGLVSVLAPLPPAVGVDDLAAVNERLLSRYRPPSAAEVRGRLWEAAILADYARPAFLVGQQYELAGQYAEARIWYQRALAIDPTNERARAALIRLPR